MAANAPCSFDIDDATGKLLHLRFATSENTFDYLHATKAYLQQWGKPIAFYSDKHGIFRSTHASMTDRTSGLTQFGRALYELNIDIICANTPQAKGRVERANQTLQDRLVKELRLPRYRYDRGGQRLCAGVHGGFQRAFWQASTQSEGHASTAGRSREPGWCHVPQGGSQAVAFLTLRYDKVMFILDPTERATALTGKKVVVCDYPDGRLEITDGEASLPYRTFDTLRSVHRSEVVENKRLDDMLSIVAELQAGRQQQRSKSGPRRGGQTDHMFGIPDGSVSNGYQKRGTKPGRKTDFTKDPAVIARRRQSVGEPACRRVM